MGTAYSVTSATLGARCSGNLPGAVGMKPGQALIQHCMSGYQSNLSASSSQASWRQLLCYLPDCAATELRHGTTRTPSLSSRQPGYLGGLVFGLTLRRRSLLLKYMHVSVLASGHSVLAVVINDRAARTARIHNRAADIEVYRNSDLM